MKPDGIVFDKTWRVACTTHILKRSDPAIQPMIAAHYLGKMPGVVTCIVALRYKMKFVGVVVFALPPRETDKRYGGKTWELARLWVDDCMPTNTETYLIAQAVDYVRSFHPNVRFLISYADPSAGHKGTIYKAANWIADGRTDQERKTPRFDYADAKTGKKYARRKHVPDGVEITRVPRISKARFYYSL